MALFLHTEKTNYLTWFIKLDCLFDICSMRDEMKLNTPYNENSNKLCVELAN